MFRSGFTMKVHPSLTLQWLYLAIIIRLFRSPAVKGQNVADSNLALVASSPFQMILSPTLFELDFAALEAVEEAISTTLLSVGMTEYVDFEAVIQQVVFLQDDGEVPSTRTRFFVLATTVIEDNHEDGNSTTAQETLNVVIESILSDSLKKSLFIGLLREDDLLQDVTRASISPTSPSLTDNDDSSSSSEQSRRQLSTVDIILIVVSSLIFMGIAYMVFQHVRDRGYFENQRMQTLNTNPAIQNNQQKPPEASLRVSSRHAYTEKDEESKIPEDEKEDSFDTLNTTMSSTPSATALNLDPTSPNYRPVRITAVTTTVAPSTTTPPLLSPSSIDGASIQSLTESFDHNLFNSNKSRRNRRFSSHEDEKRDDDPGDYGEDSDIHHRGHKRRAQDDLDRTSSGESSEDVFHIDVDSLCPSSSAGSTADKAAAAAATAISEWMKTIRVVQTTTTSGESKSASSTESSVTTTATGVLDTSSTSCSSESSSSSDSSTDGKTKSSGSEDISVEEHSTLDNLSLEGSMADSSVGEGTVEPKLDTIQEETTQDSSKTMTTVITVTTSNEPDTTNPRTATKIVDV